MSDTKTRAMCAIPPWSINHRSLPKGGPVNDWNLLALNCPSNRGNSNSNPKWGERLQQRVNKVRERRFYRKD